MISNRTGYEKAIKELRDLEEQVAHMPQSHPIGSNGFTKAGIRKMIAHLHEELAIYEGREESRQPTST